MEAPDWIGVLLFAVEFLFYANKPSRPTGGGVLFSELE